ncbi:capsule biosynthesis protein CapA [Reichenbachiella sp. 5M10]|uniref:CapA family protein n=1 Tax=Reichenbachiella sp. 5M10 TaxID=1889772 RepID=UPI000C156C16|nr:CapA family protein [Reichenbachiella sp. 5M10]PIB35809.1 capsule biosynthesis protein CapA [Reichenbachiella sp. 5M10]
MNKIVVLALLALAVVGCKTQQNLPQTSTRPEPDSVLIDTVAQVPDYYVTAKQDTLTSLDEEVEIALYRVLKDTVTIIGVGDIMMGTNFPSSDYLPGNRGRDLWSEVSDTLRQADVTFGNLEGVILNEGGEQKQCKNPKVCYLFRSPEYMLDNLTDAGFDVVSLANNHAGDFGDEGRVNTMKALDTVGIHYAGLIDAPYTVFERDGMKYGMVAFSPNKGTILIHHLEQAKRLVAQLDSMVDVVIVSFHAGAEGHEHQHVTRESEYYYGEDRGNVYAFARQMIDQGADVIFGHGPHVTRAVDLYKDRFIAYSLGNFCTYGRFNLRGVKGVAPIIRVSTDGQGRFLRAQIIPTYQGGAGGPKFDLDGRAIRIIQELTEKDFPESNLRIDDSGIISYIEN